MPITPVGTQFVYGDAGGDPTTVIANVASISDSGDTYAIMEYATTTATVTSKLAGRKTPGTVTVEVYFANGGDEDWEDIAETLSNGAARSFGIKFSDDQSGTGSSVTWKGDGIISQTPSLEVNDDVVRGTFTIEKTTAWTLA